MKWWLKRLFVGLFALVIFGLLAGRLGLLRGSQPGDLGLREGRLKPPSSKPNSVSSQTDLWPGHPQADYARIAPLAAPDGKLPAAWAALPRVVAAMPGAEIIKLEGDYLYAQFTTPLMRYTDDVEFLLDARAGVIHVRSASRLGYSDRGLNRARVEAIRKALAP
jgi:uncharacterized protein (DUF1499 family)